MYHEVFLLMNFLQTKPQIRDMNIIYYILYYTVIKSRDGKVNVDNQYETDFIIFEDFVPNPYSRKKNNEPLSREI